MEELGAGESKTGFLKHQRKWGRRVACFREPFAIDGSLKGVSDEVRRVAGSSSTRTTTKRRSRGTQHLTQCWLVGGAENDHNGRGRLSPWLCRVCWDQPQITRHKERKGRLHWPDTQRCGFVDHCKRLSQHIWSTRMELGPRLKNRNSV